MGGNGYCTLNKKKQEAEIKRFFLIPVGKNLYAESTDEGCKRLNNLNLHFRF